MHANQSRNAVVDFENLIDEALNSAPHHAAYRGVFKRVLDIALVLIMALPVLPFVLVFAALVARDGHAPFYLQRRVGRNGRVFRMWKLRTMVPNADCLLAAHLRANPLARVEWDRNQKLRNDPRITPIGRLLRKTSIDELPQLWNVLRGEMSLVGPRPMMVEQTPIYPGTAYYALRPGITGFWQTSVRNEASFSERAKFDTAYLAELSFVTDIKVLARTVKVVWTGTGC
ncbi:sugar transferase [Salipiger sp. CCB-MM3]|uniref:sugar transferase n=1 Tax=Salipiger sp. CCB-MM3 TaxID=1792508 RepID=UPI00080A9C41|nr:sugar transferase [Salipiger sp. CCB-MM3]ANT61525.1 sugar transferase [Salipiger sp. CCB-MM3]